MRLTRQITELTTRGLNASLIVNCLPQPSDDTALNEILSSSELLDQPMESANLCEFFYPARPGHDEVMLLELVHRATRTFAPRIRSCQAKLPAQYDRDDLRNIFARRCSGHYGAVFISYFTDALVIGVSETDRSVRLVQGGRMEILPTFAPSPPGIPDQRLQAMRMSSTESLRPLPMLKVVRRDRVLHRFLTSSSSSVRGTRGSGHDLIMSRLLETSQDLVNRLVSLL